MNSLMKKPFKRSFVVLLGFLLFSTVANAYTSKDLNWLLKRVQPDDGVVIEIVDWNSNWNNLITLVNPIVSQLKKISESIDIVIVSHGSEQFELTKSNLSSESTKENISSTPLTQLEILVDTNKVTVSVCGAHSRMVGFNNEKYAAFIDIADSGPALVNDYLNLDYHHLILP
jgi:intracellular sulfur oxidation DsrE/DsrF family protein